VAGNPYQLTSDDVLFEVHAIRTGIAAGGREAARSVFFSKPQACLRSSPLGKRYGWEIHYDDHGRVALVGVGTDEYKRFAEDPTLHQLTALRSRRG